jgi:hypothetical protein
MQVEVLRAVEALQRIARRVAQQEAARIRRLKKRHCLLPPPRSAEIRSMTFLVFVLI